MSSFNTATPATTPAAVAPVTSPAPAAPATTGFEFEYNGKKYTREELLTKLTHADTHIVRLESEGKEARTLLDQAAEQLRKANTVADLLKQPAPAAAPAVNQPAVVDIASEVTKALDARESAQKQAVNWTKAREAMTQAYGDKADAKAKAVAEECGMTFEQLVVLAKNSPVAFTRLFPELNKSPESKGSPHSSKSFTTPAVVNNNDEPKAASSGYWAAKNSKERVEVYLQKLKEKAGA